ncbi:MAG: MBL fold metallo-hydrolase [Pirellulales bacterium]
MKLLLLGTAGYHPNERRHTPCLLLPGCGVMLDAGTGFFRAIDRLETGRLDVFLSHVHLDHVIGLSYLFDLLWRRPGVSVRVHALPAKLEAIERHLFSEQLFPKRPPYEAVPLADETPLAGGGDSPPGRLTHFPLEHAGGSLGFRLDWPDRSMAYVTDTTAAEQAPYIERIRGVDLLVHECSFGDDQADWAQQTGHSHTTPVARVARAARVGRLILVHLNPLSEADDPVGLATARGIFPETTLGVDGMVIEF